MDRYTSIKIASRWLKLSEDEAARALDFHDDLGRCNYENARECLKDILNDEHPLTREEGMEYILAQLEQGDSEEIERMIKLLGMEQQMEPDPTTLEACVDNVVYGITKTGGVLLTNRDGRITFESQPTPIEGADSKFAYGVNGEFYFWPYSSGISHGDAINSIGIDNLAAVGSMGGGTGEVFTDDSNLVEEINQAMPDVEFSMDLNRQTNRFDRQAKVAGPRDSIFLVNEDGFIISSPITDELNYHYQLADQYMMEVDPGAMRGVILGGGQFVQVTPWKDAWHDWTDEQIDSLKEHLSGVPVQDMALANMTAELEGTPEEVFEDLQWAMKTAQLGGDDGIFVVTPDGQHTKGDFDNDLHRELAEQLGVDSRSFFSGGYLKGFWTSGRFNVNSYSALTPEQMSICKEYLSQCEDIEHVSIEHDLPSGGYSFDGDAEEALQFLGGEYVEAKLALNFHDEVGSSHRFLISPEGEFHTWDKGEGGYGEALVDLEMQSMEEEDLDLQTDLRLNMGDDTYRMYRDEGWLSGITSGGGFVLINAPGSVTPEQADALLNTLRSNNFRSIIMQQGNDKQHFSNPRDALNMLSTVR